MKTVTKLEIPPSFGIKTIELVNRSLYVNPKGAPQIFCAVTLLEYLRAELQIAYSLGVEQGLIKGLVEFKKELDIDKKGKSNE